ncbi:MAG: NAD(P)H-binding protein [Pseudolysinimonas sp.]
MKIAVAGGTGTVGHHVVEVLREHGHEPVVLARSTGVDLVTGAGLAASLTAVDVVIDVVSFMTQKADEARAFFGATTRHLLDAEKAAGVRHHVLLGIVGSQKSQYGYYLGKMRQEELVHAGEVPWTEVRATQFHEFAQQIYGIARIGPIVLAPNGRVQPIAAREVAERLVELAVGAPSGLVAELAGPREESLSRMVRVAARATGKHGPILGVPAPGPGGKAMRDGTLLPDPALRPPAQLGTQTFDEWIAALPKQ